MQMKVHGAIISPNVRKVLTVLELKGIEYETIMVRPGERSPDFLEISPLGMIPAIEHGDFRISDSRIINEYIEQEFPQNSVMPSNAKDRARCRWIEEYSSYALLPCCRDVFHERFLNPYMLGRPTDGAKLTQVIQDKFPIALNYLEKIAPVEGFFYKTLGVADIAVASPLINAEYGGFGLDKAHWPRLAAFMKRFKDYPKVASLLAAEAQMLKVIRSGVSPRA